MRVLMVGIGDIAQKAYLPVLATRDDIDLHCCTRDAAILAEVGRRWRIGGLHAELEMALTTVRFDAAFVHAATPAHPAIVEQLLAAGVATFVDKPLADNLATAERLADRAKVAGVPLVVGFNRRHAPIYVDLRQRSRSFVFMEKHRRRLLHPPRQTVFDDFIHVVDTLRFLAPGPLTMKSVDTVVHDGLLYSILITMAGDGFQAVGAMHRDGGLDTERLSVSGDGASVVVNDMASVVVNCETTRRGDWTTVTQQRGFDAMVDAFLRSVRDKSFSSLDDVIETHRICEQIACKALPSS